MPSYDDATDVQLYDCMLSIFIQSNYDIENDNDDDDVDDKGNCDINNYTFLTFLLNKCSPTANIYWPEPNRSDNYDNEVH